VLARASLSALHVLALALGFGAVFARGLRLRDLRRAPANAEVFRRLFQADAFWGIAALLWIATGFARAFGRVEKQPEFYLRNGFFWIKMALFVFVLVLEIRPMLTFIRWRASRKRGTAPDVGDGLGALVALNDAEVAIVVLIPFVAALMARGAWLF
jgi:putative membrane protein